MRMRDILAPAPRRPGAQEKVEENGPNGPTGAKSPLTPEQSRRRAERQATAARRVRDEQVRHAAKMADLRDQPDQ